MLCPTCKTEGRKFGKDRYGNQRFQCRPCKSTFSDRPAKPLDEMRLPLDKAVQVLKLLTEGCSIRSTVRLSGVAKGTVIALVEVLGYKLTAFMEKAFAKMPVNEVQVDEVWGFVGMKEKTKKDKRITDPDVGDAYCYVGIERQTKVIMAWHLGKRDAQDTHLFMEALNRNTIGRFQLTTDGWVAYPRAVEMFLDERTDYAVLIKKYGKEKNELGRYSPPKIVGTETFCCNGNPDPNRVCTSHIERANLTIRTQVRRMTRLTSGFSKKWANHAAALAIHFATYNFVRKHSTLKMTPAQAAGLTDHQWTLEELLAKSTQ